jgi:hypothetical protein
LTELFITHNDLSLPSGIKIIETIANKKALKSLALNSCKLNGTLLQTLLESLQLNENLKELYLYSNNIGPSEA